MNVVIIGGGVVGLSIAFELVGRGHDVTVVERDRFGRQASWAGAGILPPSNAQTAIHPLEHLETRSNELHPLWAEKLKSISGIDNGYQACGGLHIARTPGEKAALHGAAGEWAARSIEAQRLAPAEVQTRFGHLRCAGDENLLAYWLPGETQICNPHHIAALVESCKKLGAKLIEHAGETSLTFSNGSIERLTISPTAAAPDYLTADAYCVTAGAWTQNLIGNLPMIPVRGQMLMYRLDHAPFESVINEGTRYLVPRRDGHILFGATIEEAGFDSSTTAAGIDNLKRHAADLLPQLTDDRLVKSWAGLRPGTFDGFPYIGQLSDVANAFVAAGHFKAGLHLAPATAEAIADLIERKPPRIDLRPFAPSRTRMT